MAQLAHGKQRGSGRDFGVQETEEIGTRPYVKPLDSLAFLAILETATTRLRLLPLAVPVRAIPAFSMRIPRKREGASPCEFLTHLLRRHRPPRAVREMRADHPKAARESGRKAATEEESGTRFAIARPRGGRRRNRLARRCAAASRGLQSRFRFNPSQPRALAGTESASHMGGARRPTA